MHFTLIVGSDIRQGLEFLYSSWLAAGVVATGVVTLGLSKGRITSGSGAGLGLGSGAMKR